MDALADIGSAASEMADSLPPPPIITYPEFMLHQRRESRPLTAATLLRAGYSLGALSAGLFIFSKTCIAPMRESLLAARRELLETADQNVIKLNTQLSSLTGTPYSLTKDTKEVATSEESISAGSECFFANQATQTTPVLSRRSSTRDLTKADNTFSAGSETSNRIAEIAHNLSGATESEGPTILGELSEGITELEEFLRLIDQPESKQKPGRPYMTQNEARIVERKPEYEDMKKEIRLMKSRLLSAGSFPAARSGT